jgi:hypothetical protein
MRLQRRRQFLHLTGGAAAFPAVSRIEAGFSGNIATEAVVRAPPDGHTSLLVAPNNATSTAPWPQWSG